MPVHTCTSCAPGHNIHWIQARLASHAAEPAQPVHLLRREGLVVDVVIDDVVESWRFHDTPSTRAHLARWTDGARAELRPHGLLTLDGSGCLYPCRDAVNWRECPPVRQG